MNIENFTENSLPGMVPGTKAANGGVSSENFAVKFYHANLMDISQVSELERILTRGLDGKDIVIIEKDKYSFQENYFVVVTYLEKRNANQS